MRRTDFQERSKTLKFKVQVPILILKIENQTVWTVSDLFGLAPSQKLLVIKPRSVERDGEMTPVWMYFLLSPFDFTSGLILFRKNREGERESEQSGSVRP